MRLSSGFDLMAAPFHLLIDLMLIIVRNSKEPIIRVAKIWVRVNLGSDKSDIGQKLYTQILFRL